MVETGAKGLTEKGAFPEARKQRAKMLGVGEVAEELGLEVSTIRDWLLKRKITFVKVGERCVRIPRREVERLIREGTVPARELRR
jgi:excisionase family DNA binding protein